jgi:exopolyphosphatase/pppGpp-phosphohydrolase
LLLMGASLAALFVAAVLSSPPAAATGAACNEIGGRELVVRFISAFNRGDLQQLDTLFARGTWWQWSGTRSAVGVAGTITSLAALALGLEEYDRDRVHGFELTAEALEERLRRLASVPLAERRRIRPLDPERAPVIVAGAVIAREILAFFGVDTLEISERDILDGAALAAAELPEAEEGAAPPGAYTCC